MDPIGPPAMSDDERRQQVLQQMVDAGLVPMRSDLLAAQMRRGQGLMATPSAQGMNVPGATYVAASPLEHAAAAMARIMGGREVDSAEKGMQGLIGQLRDARLSYANGAGGSVPESTPVAPAQAPQIPPMLARPTDQAPAWSPPDFAPQAPAAPALVSPKPSPNLSPGALAALSGDPAIMAAGKAQTDAARSAQEAALKERELGQGDRRLGLEGQRVAQQGSAQDAENAYRQGDLKLRRDALEQGKYAGFNADNGQSYVLDQRTGQVVPIGTPGAPPLGPYSGKSGKQQLDKETELRKELQGLQVYKDTQQVASAYRKIESASETGAGDMSMIFGYMKLLDPNSTVREGEYATAQNAGSVPQNIIAAYNRIKDGEKLHPEVRAQFRNEAKKVLDAQLGRWKVVADHYTGLAQRYGADPANVILGIGFDQPPAAGGAPGGVPVKVTTKAERDALPPGTQYVGPDGNTYTKG